MRAGENRAYYRGMSPNPRKHRLVACLAIVLFCWASLSLTSAHAQLSPTDSCSSQAISGTPGGTVYYVSPTGSDTNNGTSPCTPWQTMTQVDRAALQPGDTVAFEGGESFSSSLAPWASLNGTPTAPITYTSYGLGDADLTGGVFLESASYLVLNDLNISSSVSRGIGTASASDPGSTGVTHVTVENSTISSTYDAGEGGYGIGVGNKADGYWLIENDNIVNTADSGIASVGANMTVENSTFSDNGVGSHCGDDPATGWASTTNNPCHAIYAKSPDWTIEDNHITNSATTDQYISTFSAITLRGQDNLVEGNTIDGGANGINFWSETTTPGTSYIENNSISNQIQGGFQTGAGTEPIVESFVISGNTVTNSGGYDAFFYPAVSPATLTLTGNTFQATPTGAYLNLANPPLNEPPGLLSTASNPYTGSTFTENNNSFTGTSNPEPWFIAGQGLTWAAYTNYFGAASEGQNDIEEAPPVPQPPAVTVTPPTVALVYPPPPTMPTGVPINTVLPRITGKTRVGQKLSISVGSWSSGSARLSYSYTWKICSKRGTGCRAIPGAVRRTLVLRRVDLGHRLAAVVTASDSVGIEAVDASPSPVVTTTGTKR